jgi:hypothetical protein
MVIANDADTTYSTTLGASVWSDDFFTSSWPNFYRDSNFGIKMRSAALSGTSRSFDAPKRPAEVSAKRGLALLGSGVGGPTGYWGYSTESDVWTASSASSSNAYQRILSATQEGVKRTADAKRFGMSVRCKAN